MTSTQGRCVSVRIDVDELLRCAAERAEEEDQVAEPEEQEQKPAKAKPPRKRKAPTVEGGAPAPKKARTRPVKKETEILLLAPTPPPSKPITIAPKVTLKLGPQPKEPDVFPCCLCVSMSREGLLRVQDPPVWRLEGQSGDAPSANAEWMAHEECANVVPETWIDEADIGPVLPDGSRAKERVVLGVDGIVNDRWNLVRHIIRLAEFSRLTTSASRNATHVQRLATDRMVPRSSARRADARRHSMFPVHAMVRR